MREIKISYMSLILAAVIIVLGIYTLNLRAELELGSGVQAKSEALSNAEKSNSEFIKSFFNYRSTKERYESIKELTTEHGYRSTFPSGMTLPKDISVESSSSKVKAYQGNIEENQIEYYNEFELTTKFQGISSTELMLVKTVLKNEESRGWKIDDVQIVASLGAADSN